MGLSTSIKLTIQRIQNSCFLRIQWNQTTYDLYFVSCSMNCFNRWDRHQKSSNSVRYTTSQNWFQLYPSVILEIIRTQDIIKLSSKRPSSHESISEFGAKELSLAFTWVRLWPWTTLAQHRPWKTWSLCQFVNVCFYRLFGIGYSTSLSGVKSWDQSILRRYYNC